MNIYQAKAYFSQKRLPLRTIINKNDLGKILKRESTYALFEYEPSAYIYLKDYGGIGFLNVSDIQEKEIFKKLNPFIAGIESSPGDTLQIGINNGEPEKGNEHFNIKMLDTPSAHIILLNLAQSAALFHYQSIADNILERTRIHTNELETQGKVSLRRKKLMRYIGSTLNIKNKISENLYIFDIPMLAYENENINKLDSALNEELEIKYRYNGIKEQLNTVKENLDLFMDISLHNHSSFLEWIIILLILFEILQVLFEKLIA